jgi:MinD superfamily P-loop ATPase
VIVDASPGTSCPVVEAVRGADFLLLVTEPTPFGLHDLKLAVQVARELGLRVGVVINRNQDNPSIDHRYLAVDDFCANEGLPVLMRIPFERRIAEGIAQGMTLIEIHPEYGDRFRRMFSSLVAV